MPVMAVAISTCTPESWPSADKHSQFQMACLAASDICKGAFVKGVMRDGLGAVTCFDEELLAKGQRRYHRRKEDVCGRGEQPAHRTMAHCHGTLYL